MLGFYGSFQKDQTYGIVLDYADSCLEDYFHNDRPVKNEDIHDFWEKLFRLIPLTVAMRELRITTPDDTRVYST